MAEQGGDPDRDGVGGRGQLRGGGHRRAAGHQGRAGEGGGDAAPVADHDGGLLVRPAFRCLQDGPAKRGEGRIGGGGERDDAAMPVVAVREVCGLVGEQGAPLPARERGEERPRDDDAAGTAGHRDRRSRRLADHHEPAAGPGSVRLVR